MSPSESVGRSAPDPSPAPHLDTSRLCPRCPDTPLQTRGLQEHIPMLKVNLHSVHTAFRLEILPLFYKDSNRDFREILPSVKKPQ